MNGVAAIAAGRRRGGSSPTKAFAGIASLFAAGEKGSYYDFTDLASLSVNADGSGGSPPVGGASRFARDLGPNANHLRNTVTSVAVRSDGIVTSGTNYGLFNMPGFGNWPLISEPLTIIVGLELLAAGAIDDRIIGSSASGQILRGTSAGSLRLFSGYSPQVQPGLQSFRIVDAVWNGSRSSLALDRESPLTWSSAGAGMDALCLGSGPGGQNCAAVRYKRLFVREGLLSATEREGVISWVEA